jgi:tetratricopeptide (TPR) repeat protein
MPDAEVTTVGACLQASRDAQRQGDFDAMLAAAERAVALNGDDPDAGFRRLECLLYCGRADRVLEALVELEHCAGRDSALWARVGEFYAHCTDHEASLRCYAQAAKFAQDNPDTLFALAAAEIATGAIDDAERHLTEVIRLNPHDYDAYRNRATLRRQSAESNHIAEIEALFSRGTRTPAGEAQLCYALAKEYEDLGETDTAFDYLSRGAAKRRSLMNYRVEGDVAVMAKLRAVFNSATMQEDTPSCDETGPVFVIGLPRSGTTLVDRILSSHSKVDSLGEINDFAYALMHTLRQSADKLALIDLAATMDFAALGRRYVDATRRYGRKGPYLVDKTPLNFLYFGLIRLALPNARIVHVHRNPMDSCYGMYRTLFRAGYPFSYDFEDLGKYYVAYQQLMEHWREVAPDGFLDVAYESLVADQERVSRRMLAYCGLNWEPACLEFHRNDSPISTASSAQVRRPIYRDAVHRWRRYERQLEPLAAFLKREHVDIEDS